MEFTNEYKVALRNFRHQLSQILRQGQTTLQHDKNNIRNLTNALHSLPQEFRQKAMDMIGQQMADGVNKSDSSDAQGDDAVNASTSAEAAQPKVVRKRGRPKKIVSNLVELPVFLKEESVVTDIQNQNSISPAECNKYLEIVIERSSAIDIFAANVELTQNTGDILNDSVKIEDEINSQGIALLSTKKRAVKKSTFSNTKRRPQVLSNASKNENKLKLRDEENMEHNGIGSVKKDDNQPANEIIEDHDAISKKTIAGKARRQLSRRKRLSSTIEKLVDDLPMFEKITCDSVTDEMATSKPRGSIVRSAKIGRPRHSTYESGHVPKVKNYRCLVCSKMLATRQSAVDHQRQHTGNVFICDYCGQRFATNSGFLLHKRYHSEDPCTYKCSKCKYIVSTQELLDDHYRQRHDPNRPKNHICDICGKGFHGAPQLDKHLVSHASNKPYACNLCDFATAYPDGLEKHKYNAHEADHLLYNCELCGVQLRSKGTYIEHIGRHFNQRKKKCDTCDKTFPNASQLAAHRRSHLAPSVPCSICGKKLRSKHKLKIHEAIHTGQKDFACPQCSYVTYAKHNLKKHCMARHKLDYPPLLNPRMRKYAPAELSFDSVNDPLTKKCIRKIKTAAASAAKVAQSRKDEAEESSSNASTDVTPSFADDNTQTDNKVNMKDLSRISTSDGMTIVRTPQIKGLMRQRNRCDDSVNPAAGRSIGIIDDVIEQSSNVSRVDNSNVNSESCVDFSTITNPEASSVDTVTSGAQRTATSALQLMSFVQNDKTFLAFSTTDGRTIAVDSSSLTNFHPSGLVGVLGDRVDGNRLIDGQRITEADSGGQRVLVLNTAPPTNGQVVFGHRVLGQNELIKMQTQNGAVDLNDCNNDVEKLVRNERESISDATVISALNTLINTGYSRIIPS